MVRIKFHPLYQMASSITHDFFRQEANPSSSSYILMQKMGVTSLGRHTRPACHLGSIRDVFIKKVDVDLHRVCFFLTLGMRGVWDYFSWFAHAQ